MSASQKKKYLILQSLVICSAIFEVLSIAFIGPFMAIVSDSSLIESNSILVSLYDLLHFESKEIFILTIGIGVVFILLISSIISIVAIWRLSIFAAKLGADYGDILFSHYLNKNYLYHVETNSSFLIKQISTEVARVTDNVLQPIMQINARIVTSLVIICLIFLYEPLFSLVGFCLFATSYLIIYFVVRKKLFVNGKVISTYSKTRFSLMNESLSSIKELKILRRENYFINKFKESGRYFSKAYGSSNTLYNAPRYIMEFIVYGGVIVLMLVLVYTSSDLMSALPKLSILAMAMFKLLPAFQQIYSGMAQIRNNKVAFDEIYRDVIEGRKLHKSNGDEMGRVDGDILLHNIFMKYPTSSTYTLSNINLQIYKNTTIGFVGSSGAGKSTLFDLILGVIFPEKGIMMVGHNDITEKNVHRWHKNIGYVPQLITLRDGTIAENIAFGIPDQEIDMGRVEEVCRLAELTDWIESQESGVLTYIGEKGVKISGGQRQRIAIARALYHDPEYLFFDEATSALDSGTEQNIMQSINLFSQKKTIVIIAHRINTLKDCDMIYILKSGQITDSGTYHHLLQNSQDFKVIAGHDDK